MRYNSYRAYLKNRFGGRVLKVPLKSGFSCPNIDGKKGKQGCIFCDNRAFSPAAESRVDPYQDFCRTVELRSDRYQLFLPYFQPYTNTYAPVSKLREVYEPLISHERSIGIAVGTRPDELPQDVCDYIK
ncbi:MAG: TIGR01212 family radical SAM protein, partial [Chitinivibrionales bacterium]